MYNANIVIAALKYFWVKKNTRSSTCLVQVIFHKRPVDLEIAKENNNIQKG